jgi:hypothetical protein
MTLMPWLWMHAMCICKKDIGKYNIPYLVELEGVALAALHLHCVGASFHQVHLHHHTNLQNRPKT